MSTKINHNNKVIITCAITGAIHTPTMSPYLPITSDEITRDAIAAAESGAAILHLHARNPETGQPDQSPEGFAPFLPRIKQGTNAVINITTGGSPYMTVEERVDPAAKFKPEVASLNMGSMNFGLYPMLNRFKEFKFDWEREHLEGSRDLVFRNSFKDIEHVLKTCYGNGTRFEFECYDISHLYNLAHFADRGLVKAPFFVQSVFGLLGGIGPHPEDVMHMKRTADRLFGTDYRWSVLGAGAVLTGSIPVIDAESGEELSRGIVPPWCVAVQASRERQFTGGSFGLPCVLVVRYLEQGERHDKAALNDVLRTHGVTT
mgnify:CR=1 FL=1